MSKKILGSFFDYDAENVSPHGIRCKGYVDPLTVRPVDLSDFHDKGRINTMVNRADRIAQRKGIQVAWCVHEVEHTNKKGTMIIDPSGLRFLVGQNAYRYVPSYKDIVAGKIISVEWHKYLYCSQDDPGFCCLEQDFWVVRFLAAQGERIKALWIDPLESYVLNCIGGASYLYTNKRDILKAYRGALNPTSPVRVGYGNVTMGIGA